MVGKHTVTWGGGVSCKGLTLMFAASCNKPPDTTKQVMEGGFFWGGGAGGRQWTAGVGVRGGSVGVGGGVGGGWGGARCECETEGGSCMFVRDIPRLTTRVCKRGGWGQDHLQFMGEGSVPAVSVIM